MADSTEIRSMVKEYQCPGCLLGSDPEDGCYKPSPGDSGACEGHVCGTRINMNLVMLGMPRGFNHTRRPFRESDQPDHSPMIRLFPNDAQPQYDHLNVPVWAMAHNGDTLVRCFMPRIGQSSIDVWSGKARADVCPDAIDVAEFQNDID